MVEVAPGQGACDQVNRSPLHNKNAPTVGAFCMMVVRSGALIQLALQLYRLLTGRMGIEAYPIGLQMREVG